MGASLFYVCFRYVLPWCLPFLLALLVAALLEPVVLYLRRKFHFQRGFSALILTLTLLFLLGGLLSLLWSTLLSQTNALLAAAPAFFDAIPAAADDLLSRLEQFSASSPEWLSGYLHEQLFRAVTDADSLLRSLSSRAMAWLGSAAAALPVFGTGTALVPWAVFTLLFGFPPKAIVLLALYLCTLITRNTLEPKLLSAQAGLPPVASLFAMYLGYCTFGVAGMVLFPFLLLLFAQIRNAKAEAAA